MRLKFLAVLVFSSILIDYSVNAVPSHVVSIEIAETYANALKLSWPALQPVGGYPLLQYNVRVWVSHDPGVFLFNATITAAGDPNYYTQTGLRGSSTYVIQIQGVDGTGLGPWSPEEGFEASTATGGIVSAPTLTEVRPAYGPEAGGTVITVLFQLAADSDLSTVLPDVSASFELSDGSWTSSSAGFLTDDKTGMVLTTPAGQPGTVANIRYTIDFTSYFVVPAAQLATMFTYYREPTVSSFSPKGARGGDVAFAVSGSGFISTGLMRLRLVLANGSRTDGGSCWFTSSTQTTCVTPSAILPSGDWPVEITLNDQQYFDSGLVFNIYNASEAPAVTSMTPVTARMDRSIPVTIIGSNIGFSNNTCLWGDAAVITSATFISASRATCGSPSSYPTAGFSFVRLSNDGESGLLSDALGFTFTPPMAPSRSTAEGAGLLGAEAGKSVTVNVTARDENGVFIPYGEELLVVVVSYQPPETAVVYGSALDTKSGVYVCTYQATIASASAVLSIFVAKPSSSQNATYPTSRFPAGLDASQLPSGTNLVDIQNSPYAIQIVASSAGRGSTVIALTASVVNVGSTFKIQSRDDFGNIRQSTPDFILPADNFVVLFTSPAINFSASVEYLGSGLYEVSYTAPRFGVYAVIVAIDSLANPIDGCPFPADVNSAPHSWTRMTPTTRPPARNGHSCVAVDDTHMCMFGGWTSQDLWCYNVVSESWNLVTVLPWYLEMPLDASKPTTYDPDFSNAIRPVIAQRSRHAAVMRGKEMIVFGGHLGYIGQNQYEMTPDIITGNPAGAPLLDDDGNKVPLGIVQGDLWFFNFTDDWTNGTWTRRWQSQPRPAPRFCHSALLWGDYVVMFGGKTNDYGSELNDTWLYHLGNNSWSELKTGGDGPVEKRCGHSAVLMEAQRMVVYGGHTSLSQAQQANPVSANVWVLDLETALWSLMPNVQQASGRPPPLYFHAAVAINTTLLVFGGLVQGGNQTSEMWAFHLRGENAQRWEYMTPAVDYPLYRYGSPPSRHSHCMVQLQHLGSKVFMFGAYDYDIHANDLWMYTPQSQ